MSDVYTVFCDWTNGYIYSTSRTGEKQDGHKQTNSCMLFKMYRTKEPVASDSNYMVNTDSIKAAKVPLGHSGPRVGLDGLWKAPLCLNPVYCESKANSESSAQIWILFWELPFM